MAKTSKFHRVMAFTGALLFLVTSLGFSGLVVWQMHQDSKKNKANTSAESSVTVNNDKNKSKEGKLEGTKLADFAPVAKVDSLQKIDQVVGTGDEVKPGDTVTAHYTGAVAATGVIFQSSHDSGQPVPFSLNGVIKGWTDGVPGMKVGGKRRLLIPADQAYGANAPQGSGIPANADLVFDIELVKIGE
ncbi:MAG TPA: FKBP-type peptidyl-prolyl cis-trans isomerase [Candidatus Saccharibacteria bacterium]|nr:FKBP-type peptidyl-prolyl cis-trans isomerase [Candidatus Saccharibacteria bacterium]